MESKADASQSGETDRLGVYAPVIVSAIAVMITGVLFASMPSIDLAVSSWFYRPDGGFVLGRTAMVVAMRNLGIWVTVATIVGLIAVGVWWRHDPTALRRWHSPRAWADWMFIMAGMAIGPGLLVNLIFKPIWGRARPLHVHEFGGSDQFTAAWQIAHQCKWNCSFFSGEASASAMALALGFVVPPPWRVATFVAAALLTGVVSFARIAAGGHFLSDVVTGWVMMALVIFILRAQVYHGALLGPLKRWMGRRR